MPAGTETPHRTGAGRRGGARPDAQAARARRHQVDALRLVLGAVLVAAAAVLAQRGTPVVFEVNLFRLVNDLPPAFQPPLLGVMQLGALGAVPVVATVALLARRARLARVLLLAGAAAWAAAKGLAVVVDQEAPEVVLRGVTLHGAVQPGLAFPATHAAVVAALATAAGPYLSRPARRLTWLAVSLVAVARVYVGAHFPIDVVGGMALGWAVGSAVHFAFGAPRGLPPPDVVFHALRRLGWPVQGVTSSDAARDGASRFRVTLEDGRLLVAKVAGRDQPENDWLYRAWRLLAYRELEDERVIASPAHRVEHEAYVTLLAERSGLPVPGIVATRPLEESEWLLVRQWVDGVALSQLDPRHCDGELLSRVWRVVRRLHEAGIAHGSLQADHVVIGSDGGPWLVELEAGSGAAGVADRARDVAELCLSLGAVVDPEVVASAAARELGAARLAEALPFLQPLALSAGSRGRLASSRALLPGVRAAVARAAGVEPPPLEPPSRVAARNLVPWLAAAFAVNLLLPQVGQVHLTLDALRRARWGWIGAVGAAAGASSLMAAVSVMGSTTQRLALGRTWAVQVAAAFTNRLAPAGLGGMGTNVRYLESAGAERSAAVGAVGLNAIAGFIVHVVALALAVPLASGSLRLRLSGPDLPDHWPVLVGVVTVLVAAGLLLMGGRLRGRVVEPARRGFGALAGALRSPRRAVLLFAGSAGVTACHWLALVASLEAVGIGLRPVTVLAVYLAGSALASASPTPGGLGALEAALVAGLTAVGVATGPAVAGVLVYRIVTYWLPVLPGAVAFGVLRARDVL